MAIALETVVKQLEDSGIISHGKLENFVPPKAHPKDGEELLRELFKQNLLTKFQAQQFAQGKAKALILGGYIILDKIGAGGMGQVYKAQHRKMERLVAIKMLPPAMMKDAAAAARFQREVVAAAKLRHPNIVAADDAAEANGVHFLVMEYVEGQDLSALVKKNGPFPVAKATNYILQAARGLEFAHKKGVIHRDIKPANLLLDSEGTVKILDMGLARIESPGAAQAELTGTGAVMGTVDYMSPEQAFNTRDADARADIYSLGCSLYYLIAGKATYDGQTVVEKILAHREKDIPSLKSLNPEVTDELEAIFNKMMAKKIVDRYQTMTEVIADLQPLVAGGSTMMSSTVASTEAATSNSNLTFLRDAAVGQTVQRNITKQSKLAKAAGNGGFNKRFALIGAGVLGVLILAGIIVSLRTKGGTLIVEKAASKPANVAGVSDGFALDFDGKAGYVATPLEYDGSYPLTVEAIVNPRSLKSKTVISDEDTIGGFSLELNRGWTLRTRKRTGVSTPAIPAKSVHVVGIIDAGEIRLYVDGISQGEKSSAFDLSSCKVLIGANPIGNQTTPPNVFDGTIDEVRISKVARYTGNFTPESRFTPDADTIALYHFDEGSGDTAFDSSKNKHHAKIVGAKWVRTNGSLIPSPVSPQTPSFSTAPTIPAESLTFAGHRYMLVVDPVAWDEAKKKAAALGGHLATITTKEENDWIKSTALASLPDDKLVWIGGQREVNVPWTWVTGEPWAFADWGPRHTETDERLRAAIVCTVRTGRIWGSWSGTLSNITSSKGQNRLHGYLIEWDSSPPPLAKAPFDAAQAKAHQQAWAKHLGTDVETTNSVGMKMVLIPPGEFMMGSTDEQIDAAFKSADKTKADQSVYRSQRNERPQHKVVITKPFLLSATEVTIGQFKKFSATGYLTEADKASQPPTDPSQPPPRLTGNYFNHRSDLTDDFPAAYITWNDATDYCQWLSTQEKAIYRLPTEAEWEYACRAGTTTQYSFGDDVALLDQYGWYQKNAGGKFHLVGTKLPNSFGLFDMHGNLFEWCGDYLDEKSYSTSTPNDPNGPSVGSVRVLRSGHWMMPAPFCRSAYRNGNPPSSRYNHYGFRIVRELAAPSTTTNGTPQPTVPAPTKPITAFNSPEFQAWMKGVQAMPAEEQVKAVSKKLVELNPGFDGKVVGEDGISPPKIENGSVTELNFFTDNVTDITPVGALRGLRLLRCHGSGLGKGALSDLRPLSGMQLTSLRCGWTEIADLTPLAGMPLTDLVVMGTRVSDLSPLRGMPLVLLRCGTTQVSDLSPLTDCKSLKSLEVYSTKVNAAGVSELQKALPNCKIKSQKGESTTPQPAASGTK